MNAVGRSLSLDMGLSNMNFIPAIYLIMYSYTLFLVMVVISNLPWVTLTYL